MPIPYQKVVLIILDGFGLAGREPGNAILLAGMPYLNSLIAEYPASAVAAAGLVVGLPWGNPGNSEVGHSAIGTGRIVIQDLAHINSEIRSGDFFTNTALVDTMEHARKHGSTLHLMGCTSPGGIHAHTDHLMALLEMASRRRVPRVRLHFVADGQDMPPQDAATVIQALGPYLKRSNGAIASVQGRSFAMDRVLNWKLTERVWHAVVLGDAPRITDAAAYLREGYARGLTDYGIEPATVVENGVPVGTVEDNDAFFYFDFRNDRAWQITSPFALKDFTEFDRVRIPRNLHVATMTKYKENFTVPFAYPSPVLPNNLGEVMASHGWKTWRIAEKEKESHVTNFINGGRLEPFPGEQRDIVSSRPMRGKEYLEYPEMSAEKIVQSVLAHITDEARLYVVNFANPDMIAHQGNLAATIAAMKVTDDSLKQLIEPLRARSDTAVIITSDHGNAEELIDPLTGGEDTQHSTRNVPAVFIAPELRGKGDAARTLETLAEEAPIGTLVDIAPSVLHLLGVEKPAEMTGSRLIAV